jgi:glycosyltransferase involved in cell wall biosynthesis
VTAPLVGVAVPCYQHGQYLGAMLESLRAQTFDRWACVVMMDGPDDRARAIADAHASDDSRITVLAHPTHRGLPESRNAAVRALDAPWLLPFDADDLMDPQHIEALYGAAEAQQRVNPARHAVSFAPARLMWPDGRRETFVYPPYDPPRLPDHVQLPGCSLMPRALFDELGGYDPAWNRGATDWMFWVRAARLDLIAPIQTPSPTWTYRQHNGFRNHHRGVAVLNVLKREMRRAFEGKRLYGDPLTLS